MMRIPKTFLLRKNVVNHRGFASISSSVPSKSINESEYYDEAPYPPIKQYPPTWQDNIDEKQKLRREKISRLELVEEKMLEINMPKFYGYKTVILNDNFPYNAFPHIQYYTNTEFVLEKSHVEPEETKKIEDFLSLIKSDVIDAFEFELDGHQRKFNIRRSKLTEEDLDRIKSGGIAKQLNRIIINALGADNPHLLEADVDYDPRHEAFWFVGGIDPSNKEQSQKRRHAASKPFANNSVHRSFAYIGSPFLALRHLHPLLPYEDIDFSEMTEINGKIPVKTIDPRALGFKTEHRHGTSVPGFWPGNVREYGLMQYYGRYNHSKRNPDFGAVDDAEALHSKGIMTSFAWLHSQAFFNGFTTFDNMTYPLSTQTIITDGQFWSFYKYQLNTTATYFNGCDFKNKYNKCWGTPEMKLYESIENGKLQGVNDEVLKNLLTFYLNQPVQREHQMKPLLGAKEKKAADLDDLERRAWLEKRYKQLMVNEVYRSKSALVPEIYNWEQIYKIKFKTRPLDKRRRFFEIGINPFRRELDEHMPEYIPRKFRARGPHDKVRYRPTFYPESHNYYRPRATSWKMIGAAKEKYHRLMDKKRKSYK